MAWVITFNSFKGGAGRSTTCVNVAAQLAKSGKKILLVDLDVDGPGMGTFLEKSDDKIKSKGLISFVASSDEAKLKDHVISIYGNKYGFDFMGAPLNFEESAALPSDSQILEDKISHLINLANEQYDFVIIDGASGFSNHATLALSVADCVVLCFKWSLQHVRGMFMTARVLCMMLERDNFELKDFILVANAVPSPENPSEKEQVEGVKTALTDLFSERWDGDKMANGLPISELQIIPEVRSMKFQEHIALDDKEVTPAYSKLGKHIDTRQHLASKK